MKLTNRLNLPEPLVELVRRMQYERGEADFSITEILRPPRLVELERQHDDELVEDASEHIYRVLGSLTHLGLERAGVPERRYVMDLDVDGRHYSIAGKPDRFKDGVLQDWKLTTAWKAKGQVCPPEFEEQLNGYAELMRSNGYDVRQLEAILILRDWSKLEMFRNENYPRHQVAVLSPALWGQEQAREFLRHRVRLHLDARRQLPECAPADRWAKEDVYAVMKKGRKTAVRLFNNAVAADTYIREQGLSQTQHFIVKRPGENTRCKFYCAVASVCEQYKKLSQVQNTEDEE
jgi:hypothetical protein